MKSVNTRLVVVLTCSQTLLLPLLDYSSSYGCLCSCARPATSARVLHVNYSVCNSFTYLQQDVKLLTQSNNFLPHAVA